MTMPIAITNKNDTKEALIAIGQELINRAEDITRDLEHVISITIYAELNPTEVVNFNIKKNYIAYLEGEKNNKKVGI